MKKQTSTEWLFEKLWEAPKDKLTWNALLKQAKCINRIQIENSFDIGVSTVLKNNDMAYSIKDGEQYYKETYGK